MALPVIRQRDLKTYQIVETSTEYVYKSTYEPTGHCVFIKLLSLADQSERRRQEILREVEFIGRIKSERLTETLGIYRTPNTIGIVTEWMPNVSLHSLIYQRDLCPELPLSICISILKDVAEGLCFLHNLNPFVVHQRLKPCNILLDAQYRAKLSDFWLSEMQKISVSLDKDKDTDKDNNTSLVYLSPQRLQRHRPTREDDIYSFGMLLYETLSRKQPFLENNPIKLETEIIRGIRPQPNIDVILKATALPHSQRTNLNQLINLCWHKNPNIRPSAAECLSRLRSVQQTFSSEETKCGIHTLQLQKERATQHSQTREVEYDIRYLDECWTTSSNRSRTQSAPVEGTEASSLCSVKKKEQRSASLPVPSIKTSVHTPNSVKNYGARWTHREPGDQPTRPQFVWCMNYVETLTKNREVILTRMTEGHLNCLIDIMRSKFVLTRADYENIKAERTLQCRTRKYLDTCSQKGEEASQMVIDNLRSRNVISMQPRNPA